MANISQLAPRYPQELLQNLIQLWTDPSRRQFLRWLVGGSMGAIALALLMESSRGLCRTPMETVRLVARVVWTICKTLVQYIARGCKPKFPKWTLRFELLRGIMRDGSNMYGERIVEEQHARVIRRHSELFGALLDWFARRQLQLESVQFNGLEHVWLKSQRSSSKTLVVLFYHGGGYAVLSPRMYISFCSALANAITRELALQGEDVSVDVFLANYRKLPEYQFPVPAEDAVAMYKYVLQQGLEPSQVVLAGDSAGGGLVMSTLLRVREAADVPLPRAAIVACPLADMTEEKDDSNGQHCVLSANMTAAIVLSYHPTRHDPTTWADASPVHCDLRGLPPVFVQAASLDRLFQHSLRLVEKAKEDGATNWELDVHEGMPHVFMVFPSFVLPYAHVGIQRMAAFAAKQFLHSGKEDVDTTATATAGVKEAEAGETIPSAA